MATFLSGAQCGVWGAQPRYWTLTGDVSRSGNTVTLSNIRGYFTVSNGYSYGVNERMCIRDGGNIISDTTVTWAFLGGTSNTVALNNCSFSVGASDTSRTLNLYAPEDNASANFTVSFPSGASGPSGASMSWVSHTWNSVTMKGRVTNWGQGYSGTPSRHFIFMQNAWNSGFNGPRRELFVNSASTSEGTYTISNSNYSQDYEGGYSIIGCTPYRVGMWYGTNIGSGDTYDNTLRYTPPSPLSSATATAGSYIINDRKYYVAISATGGSSSNNRNVNVNTYYRYKTSSSSTWGSWTLLGTGTPWTTKSTTLKLDASTTYNFQFCQYYQNQSSSVYSVNVTTPATPDVAILYVPVSGRSKKITKLYFSLNGISKRLVKLYASVNGVAKRIF